MEDSLDPPNFRGSVQPKDVQISFSLPYLMRNFSAGPCISCIPFLYSLNPESEEVAPSVVSNEVAYSSFGAVPVPETVSAEQPFAAAGNVFGEYSYSYCTTFLLK